MLSVKLQKCKANCGKIFILLAWVKYVGKPLQTQCNLAKLISQDILGFAPSLVNCCSELLIRRVCDIIDVEKHLFG